MNISRGLFRAWMVTSILWIIGAGTMYWIIAPDAVHGSFQPDILAKGGLDWTQIDFKKPFYETMRSPSAEQLVVHFHLLDQKTKTDFDKDAGIMKFAMSDGSHVYMTTDYNDADRKYIVQQFLDQRWSRYAEAAAQVALWTLVPCIAVYVLGYAVLWIGRGFKSN